MKLMRHVPVPRAEIEELLDRICSICDDPIASRRTPFAADWYEDEAYGGTMLAIWPSAGQLVGGKDDGATIFDQVYIDLERLRAMFDVADENFRMELLPGSPDEEDDLSRIVVRTTRLRVCIYLTPSKHDEPGWRRYENGMIEEDDEDDE